MKKLIAPLFVLLFSDYCFGQSAPAIVIKPGVGIGQLKLGMNERQARAILQMPESDITWSSYEEQMEKFVGWGIAVDSAVQFLIGFDSCARFESKISDVMPVFALYFKNHKLNFIIVSSFSGKEEVIKRVKTDNGLAFYSPMSTCIKKMGKDYLNISPGEYTADMFYLNKGIELVIDSSRLRSVGIFYMMPNYKLLLAANSERLKKEASKYSKEESLLEKLGQ